MWVAKGHYFYLEISMFPQLDPSQLDPKTLAELSRLIQTLPPELLSKIQSLMHNSMAGHDVRNEMEALEKQLPEDFRSKIFKIMSSSAGEVTPPAAVPAPPPKNIQEARLTLLRAVASGSLSPEDALSALFPAE